MKLYRLKPEQKALLRTLVTLVEADKLVEPIAPFPLGNPTTQFVLYLRGTENFTFKRISDLDALADAGLLTFRWNRHGTGKLYHLTDAAYTAVANDFQQPLHEQDFDLQEIIRTMRGGAPASTIGEHVELAQVVADATLRPQVVDALCDALRAAVQGNLSTADFVAYDRAVRQLADEVLRPRPNGRRLTEAARILSLTGNIRADVTTMLEAWAYLYPLLLIGAARSRVSEEQGDDKPGGENEGHAGE